MCGGGGEFTAINTETDVVELNTDVVELNFIFFLPSLFLTLCDT